MVVLMITWLALQIPAGILLGRLFQRQPAFAPVYFRR